MTPEELQDHKEQREFDTAQAAARRDFMKWLIDKLVTAGPGLITAVLGFYIAYQGAANHTEITESAKKAEEGRTVIAEKIDEGHKVATAAVEEAKTAVEKTLVAAEETKSAVAELKTTMPPPDAAKPDKL